jgi:hypothetical protein
MWLALIMTILGTPAAIAMWRADRDAFIPSPRNRRGTDADLRNYVGPCDGTDNVVVFLRHGDDDAA